MFMNRISINKKLVVLTLLTTTCVTLSGCELLSDGTTPLADGSSALISPPINRQYGNFGGTYSPGGYRGYRSREVSVPDSTFFEGRTTPVSHKQLDADWARQQNPQNYTIEIANDEKPAQVADTLQKIPKQARVAQIKEETDSKVTYRGVYGSYPDQKAAEEAMKKLPEDVRGQAKVKQWEQLQKNQNQSASTSSPVSQNTVEPKTEEKVKEMPKTQ